MKVPCLLLLQTAELLCAVAAPRPMLIFLPSVLRGEFGRLEDLAPGLVEELVLSSCREQLVEAHPLLPFIVSVPFVRWVVFKVVRNEH